MAEYSGRDKRLQYLFSRTEDMQGATDETDGKAGIVPAPQAGDEGKFLRGDGTWAEASEVSITPLLSSGTRIANFSINGNSGALFAPESGGGGGLPGQGYTGSDLILRDARGNISSVWYIDSEGNWVEYKSGGSGQSFAPIAPDVKTAINYTFTITVTQE